MIVQMSHRYVCDVANEVDCKRSNNSKKNCKTCRNCNLYRSTDPKIYICPLLSQLALKANPLASEIDVEVKPYCVCSKWKSKPKKKK